MASDDDDADFETPAADVAESRVAVNHLRGRVRRSIDALQGLLLEAGLHAEFNRSHECVVVIGGASVPAGGRSYA